MRKLLQWICDPVWLDMRYPGKARRRRYPFNAFGAIDGRAGAPFRQSRIDVVSRGKAWSGTLTRMSGFNSCPTVNIQRCD
jgi:hypothetical protein